MKSAHEQELKWCARHFVLAALRCVPSAKDSQQECMQECMQEFSQAVACLWPSLVRFSSSYRIRQQKGRHNLLLFWGPSYPRNFYSACVLVPIIDTTPFLLLPFFLSSSYCSYYFFSCCQQAPPGFFPDNCRSLSTPTMGLKLSNT